MTTKNRLLFRQLKHFRILLAKQCRSRSDCSYEQSGLGPHWLPLYLLKLVNDMQQMTLANDILNAFLLVLKDSVRANNSNSTCTRTDLWLHCSHGSDLILISMTFFLRFCYLLFVPGHLKIL